MSIVMKSLNYETPDGTPILCDLTLSLNADTKYGLVGPNGIGKSTLARLISGEIEPSSGICKTAIHIPFFRQDEPPPKDLVHLSGGEWTRLRINRMISQSAAFYIFDEPTNNLDSEGRAMFTQFVKSSRSGMLIISHDRELLEHVDLILELSNRGITKYGGNWSFYVEQSHLEHEQELHELEQLKRLARDSGRHRDAMLLRQEKRARHGKAKAVRRGLSKIEAGGMKRKSQSTFGKLDQETADAQARAIKDAHAALEVIKTKPQIYAEFPQTKVAASKLIFEAQDLNFRFTDSSTHLWSDPINMTVRGPAKLAIQGANGSGKSTFLRLLTDGNGLNGELSGKLKLGNLNFRYLDQTLSSIDPQLSILANVEAASQNSRSEVRNSLAQFLFSGNKINQIAHTLSGGEKLRLALAKALLSDPAPQLLILDEPTNNVDVMNIEFLEAAIRQFQGALLVVSHDSNFIENIGVDEFLFLNNL